MSTPVEITNLISAISPENIEKFCRLKFSEYDFERTQTERGYWELDYSEAKVDPNYRSAVRMFIDATKDGIVKVIGKFKERNSSQEPIYVYSVPMKGSITSRSSKKKQADFARHLLKVAQYDLAPYAKHIKGWDTGCIRALFFFHDEQGNFRLSLIDSDKKVFRRFTYYVEQDTTGTKNRSFRYRMTNAANDKAAKGEVERWKSYGDIKKAFSVEELTKEFYKELFAWYERAVASPDVIFPCETAKKKEGESEAVFRARVKSEQVIRLITRLLFVWFIKQKNLVPNDLFDRRRLEEILKSFQLTKGDNYYRAILQNLFFATLNSEIPDRAFANDGTLDENREHFDIKTLYRYSGDFAIPKDEVLKRFRSIPFLNGGLFECLDRGRDYYDGFSRNKDKVAHVPNAFFFDDDEKTLGLIPLLQRYNFTIDENAHDDQDIALDPELLGKVFENLLGAFNPETSTTARNATGSFYTPREIVNYMVDESLIAYLLTKLQSVNSDQADAQRAEHEKVLRELFADGVRPADEALCHRLDAALTSAKILDPACGSGAFPMGMLLRMVELLRILRQIPAGESLYDLKLQLIENCIYGVDIQCIAVQISKLRFFISLVCEQTRSDDTATNYGINPLPNLETKFVAADSLIGLPDMKTELPGFDTANIGQLKTELWAIRHRHFQARTYREKKKLRQEDEAKRQEIKAAITQAIAPNLEKLTLLEAERAKVDAPDWQVREKPQDNNYLITDLAPEVKENTPNEYDANARKRKLLDADIATEKKKQSTPATLIDAMTRQLTDWNPYDQNASSPYFDPEWMFNVNTGFDVVIGNPPYVSAIDHRKLYGDEARDKLKTLFKSATGAYDYFILFIEKGVCLCSDGGALCYITPNKFLSANYAAGLRTWLSENGSIDKLLDVSCVRVFEKAAVYPVVSLFMKKQQSHSGVVALLPNKRPLENFDIQQYSTTKIPIELLKLLPEKIWGFFLSSNARLLPKIMQFSMPMSCFGEVNASTTAAEADKYGSFLTNLPVANALKVVNTGTLERYTLKWGLIPLTHQGKKYLTPYLPIQTAGVSTQRINMYKSPKIIYAKMAKTCKASVDYSGDFAALNVNFFFSPIEGVNLEYIAGVCNSRMFMFLYDLFFGALRMGGGYYQFQAPQLRVIPIPKATSQVQQEITHQVKLILAAKKANPYSDTSALEAEIDKIVYRLYGLTTEEIAIVEAATAKSLAGDDKKGGKGGKHAKSATADGKAAKAAENAGVATEDTGDEASKASTVEPPATTEPPATAAPKRRGRPPQRQQPTAPPATAASKRGDQQAPGTPVTDI